MNPSLSMAEQRIDERSDDDTFGGRPVRLLTGRVRLHAMTDGRAVCDRDSSDLTPVDRPWDTGYLPHLPRCADCLARLGEPVPDTDPTARDVDIRTAHGSEPELAAAAALRAVLDSYDLRRWMFTDLVTVDERMHGAVSHPLTIGPVLLTGRPVTALTSFLHEQLHWPVADGGTASAEARTRWPDPPSADEGGAGDPTSTWTHLSVCALEYFSLGELIGIAAATDELRQHEGYSWIYGQILADPDWFAGFLDRHGLRVPGEASVPRRCFSVLPG